MGLNLNQQTNALAQLANALGLDVGQNQWAQGFDLNRELAQHGLNMDAARLNQGAYQFDKTFPLQEAGVTGTYQGQPTVAAQTQAWNQTMDQWKAETQMADTEFNQWLKTEALKLDKAKHATEADYKAYLKSKGLSEDQGKTVTNRWLSGLLALDDPVEAFKTLAENSSGIANSGANVSLILSSLRNRWPDFYRGDTGGSTTLLDALEARLRGDAKE